MLRKTMTAILDDLVAAIGADYVLTGDATAKWQTDWTGDYVLNPAVVVRPGSTDEVAAVLRIANAAGLAVVPVSGNTGLTGATSNDGALMLSVDRLNAVRKIDPDARSIVVEAGVILSNIHNAADEHDLIFPLTFGARGSAMIGGALSTNAGGSNVLRYGNTRDLCLGVEVVLADGRVMDLMSELHKDNSGLNLRNLMIGAEGTLGVITAAVLKLRRKPLAYATAMVAVPTIEDGLALLNDIQDATGGAVEAFEYMPKSYIDRHMERGKNPRRPFDQDYDVNVMIEIGATAPKDATPGDDGAVPIVAQLETTLAAMFEDGRVLDAVVAQNEAQRREMWDRREAAGEILFDPGLCVNTDIAVPLGKVGQALRSITARLQALDPDVHEIIVSHLGDGNIHHTAYPRRNDPDIMDAMVEAVEDAVQEVGGSFSAEHGVGKSKLETMRRRKDPVALDAMRAIKAALDPKGIMNPGKVIPT
ncbi:FAD-binding oxidoreductase [Yoonia sp.]|uniref:FAD-binding oxidoreductase n=1 Tax=Yoonia sp. TaxID=2212373 RepID=UPI002394157A|nr:FAD-binding oxidoreductase [Yoonia sp.]MDE0849859.1 FAD-binding oxidoreductase [Yoonia sp.]